MDFKPEHMRQVAAKDKTGVFYKFTSDSYLEYLTKCKIAQTALNRKGEAIAIAGTVEYWPGRCEGWAFIANETPAQFLAIHRQVKRVLSKYIGRIECSVVYNFKEGHHWAHLLGFKLEARRMRNYFEGGIDGTLYARVGSG